MSQTVSDTDYLTCPVCLDTVVCPYSFGCGHTLDARCFVQLQKKECPKCRFKLGDTKRYAVNLMLQQLLKGIVPNYEQLEQEQMKFVKSIGLFELYKKSIRYNTIRRHVKTYNREHEHIYPLSDLIDYVYEKIQSGLILLNCKKNTEPESESDTLQLVSDQIVADNESKAVSVHQTHAHAGLQLEISFILDNLNYFSFDIDGQIYVINSKDEADLSKVLSVIGNKLSHLDIIKLMSWTLDITDEIEHSGLNLRKTYFLDDHGRELIIDHLIEIGDHATKQEQKPSYESSTEDESDEEV